MAHLCGYLLVLFCQMDPQQMLAAQQELAQAQAAPLPDDDDDDL